MLQLQFIAVSCKFYANFNKFHFSQTEITNLGSLMQIFQAVVDNKHLEVSGSDLLSSGM